MADTDFSIDGWEEFAENFSNLVDKWEEKKIEMLKKIGTIMEAEITISITNEKAVDTNRLRSSFRISVGGSESVQYATNVHYAIYVNDGHVQHRRFLPVKYLSVGGRAKCLSGNNKSGIMLRERYVPGKHYIEKGMQNATPRIERTIESFMRDCWREVEGGNL